MLQESRIVLHCGAQRVTRQMVEAVAVPEHTESWAPVPYGQAIAFLHDTISRHASMHAFLCEAA